MERAHQRAPSHYVHDQFADWPAIERLVEDCDRPG
jgi:hypothetical protein